MNRIVIVAVFVAALTAPALAQGPKKQVVIPVLLEIRAKKCQVQPPVLPMMVGNRWKIIWSITNDCGSEKTVQIVMTRNVTTNQPVDAPADDPLLDDDSTSTGDGENGRSTRVPHGPRATKNLHTRVNGNPPDEADEEDLNQYKYEIRITGGTGANKNYDPEIYIDWPGVLMLAVTEAELQELQKKQ